MPRDRRPSPESGERRSLTHVGGEPILSGDHALASELAHALDVPPSTLDEDAARAHVHGFHTYPARMHPLTARRLVELTPPGGTILDPFAGSGTVLIEAMLSGRNAVGVDLNPLAVLLARFKTTPITSETGNEWLAVAAEIREKVDARRLAKAGASRRYGHADVAAFEPHVLLELDSLRQEIQALPEGDTRAAMRLIFSSLLVKMSRKSSDTVEGLAPKRTAAGFPTKFFVRKLEETVRRLIEFSTALPSPTPEGDVLEDDATKLQGIADESIDGIVTSPPYVGTYNYIDHHALRLRWLGLPSERFEEREIGALRRFGSENDDPRDRWINELHWILSAFACVLAPEAPLMLVIADSAIDRTPILADESVLAAIGELPLEFEAGAKQVRPHFHSGSAPAFHRAPRYEHVLLLRKTR